MTVKGTTVESVAVNDGTNTTTTTTTTTSPAQTKSDTPAPTTTATFNGGDASLYTKKSKTFADVLGAFQTRVAAAPWYTASTGWFTVSVASGACPNWVVPKTDYTPSVPLGDIFCGSVALGIYSIAGLAVIVMAAWAAFRIAFL
ncbi:hypothetical protein OR16_34708 [Cupriavidus basilensis OR16]|uniref:Uncharacterized protein n=1 Tax=Cupriavidus basilensis OR16 TaxID=1127483 RepID=H1SF40_9BURK|nr:hypothetical protein OR16_34708 [Cupriavidus basilensis OR16]